MTLVSEPELISTKSLCQTIPMILPNHNSSQSDSFPLSVFCPIRIAKAFQKATHNNLARNHAWVVVSVYHHSIICASFLIIIYFTADVHRSIMSSMEMP